MYEIYKKIVSKNRSDDDYVNNDDDGGFEGDKHPEVF
jgi:hypothetical protein